MLSHNTPRPSAVPPPASPRAPDRHPWRRPHRRRGAARGATAALCVALWCGTARLASGFHFYLQANERRCFSESAPPNTKVLVEYTVSTGAGVMPVDLTVTMDNRRVSLVTKTDVQHGKVAFVLPFAQPREHPRVLQTDVHRRNAAPRPGTFHPFRHAAPGHGGSEDHRIFHEGGHKRRLLSVDERGEGEEAAYHGMHGGRPYDDLDDDLEDLDMDNYDGIHDDDLDAEVAINERKHIESQGADDTVSDAEKERRLFETRQFEMCLINSYHKDEGRRRRVKLVIHKGDSAHDYTRLAKTEDLSQLETSLQHISTELHQLMRELDHTQQMENILYRMNEGTYRRVLWLSLGSLLTLIAVAAYQASYTRRFFKRKKLL